MDPGLDSQAAEIRPELQLCQPEMIRFSSIPGAYAGHVKAK